LEADVDVVRDVLDTSVIERNGREMGRVDGIVIEPRPNQPVHLTALLIGPSALGDRLHPAVGRVVRRIEKRFGLDRDRPARVAFADVDEIGPKIRLRLTISETAVAAVEQRLRSWLVRLPGSR
jgi:sporulation protein YlmC with PRC-barrel domain